MAAGADGAALPDSLVHKASDSESSIITEGAFEAGPASDPLSVDTDEDLGSADGSDYDFSGGDEDDLRLSAGEQRRGREWQRPPYSAHCRPSRASSAPPPVSRHRYGHAGHGDARGDDAAARDTAARMQPSTKDWASRLAAKEARLAAREAALLAVQQRLQRALLRVKAQAARAVADAAEVEAQRLEVSQAARALQQTAALRVRSGGKDSHAGVRGTAPGARGGAAPAGAGVSGRLTPRPGRRGHRLVRRMVAWFIYLVGSVVACVVLMMVLCPPPALAAARRTIRVPVRVTDRPDL
jgi:hypothetical protein